MRETRYETIAAGAPLSQARGAVILLHGRGGSAYDMLGLAEAFANRDLAYFAVEAPGGSWYPYSFLAPSTQNEPYLTQSLAAVGDAVAQAKAGGVPADRIAFAGFSQGACLALEYAGRHAERFGGVAAFSGGLIGPPGVPRDYAGSLEGTPVFIGCSDVDAHIPIARVHESADVLQRMGAFVTKRIYPGMGHTIVDDEIRAVRAILDAIGTPAQDGRRRHAV